MAGKACECVVTVHYRSGVVLLLSEGTSSEPQRSVATRCKLCYASVGNRTARWLVCTRSGSVGFSSSRTLLETSSMFFIMTMVIFTLLLLLLLLWLLLLFILFIGL